MGKVDGATFQEIEPEQAGAIPTAAQVSSGLPVPKVHLIQVLSAEEWESFTEEWLMFHRESGTYQSIQRSSGAGDRGLDVVGFTAAGGFAEPWDSFQCKHYDHALTPTDVYPEIAKIIVHSFHATPPFNQAEPIPRKHIFVAPKGIGIKLGRLLKDPARLKESTREAWEKHCANAVGKGIDATLADDLLEYFDAFDFSIFGSVTGPELIEGHSKTVFHPNRFGGGLPPRGAVTPPPSDPATHESRYLRKLFDAYTNDAGAALSTRDDLEAHDNLRAHYDRQRVLFYHAEALRNFARDRLPEGTFELLQDDVFFGVVDVCGDDYESGFARLNETLVAAGALDISGNALSGVTRVPDKQGVCHQLANEDRLTWVKDGE